MSQYDNVPPYMICPISLEIMEEPVICSDGNTYEKKDIERWLGAYSTSPLTNLVLANKVLIPNRAIKTCIEMYHENVARNYLLNSIERALPFTKMCPFIVPFEVGCCS